MGKKSDCLSLGKVVCKVCSRETDLKVNINGLVFVYCRNKLGVRDEGTAIICAHKEQYGIEPSKIAFEMYKEGKSTEEIYEFLKNYKYEEEQKIEPRRKQISTGNTRNSNEFEPIFFDW
ncbi:MAG: hypothetical protein BWY78_01090 [Alphaproteobacteria bacterium ADurb.Bin438]|nr:MAG: hypothetical protein BWY78_01090 [Alphaproteobacteria bacterium ADurb.Bin438]